MQRAGALLSATRIVRALSVAASVVACSDAAKSPVEPTRRPGRISPDVSGLPDGTYLRNYFDSRTSINYPYIRIRAVFINANGVAADSSPVWIRSNVPVSGGVQSFDPPVFLWATRIHDNTNESMRIDVYRSRDYEGTSVIKCGSATFSWNQRNVARPLSATGVDCDEGFQYDDVRKLTIDWQPISYPVASVTTPNASTNIGSVVAVTPVVRASNGTQIFNQSFSGTVADTSIATISCSTSSCLLTGRRGGVSTYSVTTGGVTGSATITVRVPLSVAILGPSTVYGGDVATWTASVTGGLAPLRYQWVYLGSVVSTSTTWRYSVPCLRWGGVRDVTLNVTDSVGTTASVTKGFKIDACTGL